MDWPPALMSMGSSTTPVIVYSLRSKTAESSLTSTRSSSEAARALSSASLRKVTVSPIEAPESAR